MFNKRKKQSAYEPINYSRNFIPRVMFISSVFMLFLPIISIIIYSFNNSKRITIWRGFTLKNYQKAFFDEALREAFINSLTIAAFATVLSLILGVMSAYLIWRFRFFGRGLYRSLLSLPIVVPEICMGVALLLFFNSVFGSISIGGVWPFNLSLITIAHITFCFPFVSMVVSARMNLFSGEQLEAAFDLGASEIRAFVDVVLPFLKPAIISGAMLSFTLSLDDFVITFFTSGPDTVTFPVKVYSMLRFSVTPVVNAASTILIAITVFLTLCGMAFQRKNVFY